MGQPGNVQQYLKGVSFPCSKNDLVSKVRENGAPNEVISSIQSMPQEMFNSAQDVTKAYEAQM